MKNLHLPSATDIDELITDFVKECKEDVISPSSLDTTGDVPKDNLTLQGGGSLTSYERLMGMEGLENVKEVIQRQISFASIMKIRKELGFKIPSRVFHLILTGDSGTGKTTVARLIGDIFHEKGLLSSGHTVDVNRAKLVGRYIGETEDNTRRSIEQAKGGVLLIDEIYSLTSELAVSDGATRDFGIKVIDTLIPVMSDPESDLIVIGCGYRKEMRQFLSANPGLASRFSVVLDFENLTLAQLKAISVKRILEYGFTLSEDAEKSMESLIAEAMKIRGFGNGRFAITLVENYLIPNVCSRIYQISVEKKMTAECLKKICVIEAKDIPSIETIFPLKEKASARVGFKS